DITERRKVEKEREKIDSELQRSNQDLQDFAFSASHDLQEPLRKFTAFSQRLQAKYADSLGGEGKLYLERMQKATERMQRLINNLLLYSRITTRAKPFHPTKLERVVAEVLTDLEPRLAETGGRVEAAGLPAVDCDKFQIRQLFQNLIVNALKFHKKGVPPVVTLKSRRLDGGLWEIRVKDNGIGFDEKYAERIFKPFERLHGQSEFEGSGIGLAICRKIVARHRGSIAATGALQQGATFIVTLPEKHPDE
ncbi:MAG: ATP-binding protein, partial [Nitrospinales bacterium]